MTLSKPECDQTAAPQATIRIMETTDLHMQLLPFDYFNDCATVATGLIPLAAQIAQIRAMDPSAAFLFDNGDFLQGNPLADFVATQQTSKHVHPMITAMNTLQYDAVCLGNHEFNYGLAFLDTALAAATFKPVCANIKITDGENLYDPFTLIDRMITCSDGQTRAIRIGVVGLVTPQVVNWDKSVLNGAIQSADIVDTARVQVPRMRAQGADIIIALCHAGIDRSPWKPGHENAALHLAAVDGIDAILTGHTHEKFPDRTAISDTQVNHVTGQLNGTPAVMAGFYGSHLGLITLDLTWVDGAWTTERTDVTLICANADTAPTPLQIKMIADVMPVHTATLAYIRQPFATTALPINSHFATVAPDLSLALLGQAQLDAVRDHARGTDWADLPVLSAAAPFQTGGHGGPTHYIDIQPGPLTLRDAAAIYPFANRLYAVRRSGAQVKQWLNKAAGIFNTLVGADNMQTLLRHDIAPYNFDVMFGLTYTIDISRPTNRISQLWHNGIAVADTDMFVVATNSYRANGGGDFLTAPPDDILHVTSASTRDVLIEKLRLTPPPQLPPAPVWRFASMPDTCAQFLSAPHAQAPAGPHHIAPTGRTVDGFAEFTLSL